MAALRAHLHGGASLAKVAGGVGLKAKDVRQRAEPRLGGGSPSKEEKVELYRQRLLERGVAMAQDAVTEATFGI